MSKVLMVASEANPFAKTGGLADVLGVLPGSLRVHGDDVSVVLPQYPTADPFLAGSRVLMRDVPVWLGSTQVEVNIRVLPFRGADYYFIDCPLLFDREGVYGDSQGDYPDNHVRFATLCHGAIHVIRSLFRPDIVHCHDWQSGLIAPLFRQHFSNDPTFLGMRLLLTIHNLGYQGVFPRKALGEIGISEALFRPDALEFYGMVNFLKGGIVFSDAISTVSKGYAREIQTPEYGFGLDGLLRSRSGVLTGIMNGVDYHDWSPEEDRYIVRHYDAQALQGKQDCKLDVLAAFDLPADNMSRPLIGMVSRFAEQKGFDLIARIATELLAEDICLTVVGSGDRRYEQLFIALQEANPDRVAVRITYSDELAHKVEAGADMFLMPSRYEPCGLNQIYSLRYGTIPIVRATGGLDDTIDEETGFKFREYSGAALLAAIREALRAYKIKPRWERMMRRGMQKDHSWDASAAEYSALYKRLLG